jgi:hypothetical protein
MKPHAKLGNSFFGDSGTELNSGTREDMEKDAYAQGHRGNDVDIAQQYAPSEADEYTEQAERMTRDMERSDGFKHSGQFADPEKRREFVEELAERLRGRPARPTQPAEEQQEPFNSEKFWSNPEEVKRAGKAVRPTRL